MIILISVGDVVTRKSHNNDIVFKVLKKEKNICYLKGVELRLIADADEKDLVKVEDKLNDYDCEYAYKALNDKALNRSDYFYLPGKILHIDGDNEYLAKCMEYYKKAHVLAYGKSLKESDMSKKVTEYLEEIKPDILIITGHDAFYDKENGKYKNSINFIKAVRKAREYEKSNEGLIIIAGACQSDYEDLIRSGATFASSPKRINIHALDPAIIAVSLSYADKSKEIDLISTLSKTKYGADGIGGIKTKGTMYVGYPRNGA